MKKFMLLLSATLVLGACSKVEKQLHSFEKNTDRLDKTTSDVAYTTEEIQLIANAIFPQIRSGDSIRIRNEEWDILTNKNKGIGEKAIAAGVFFQGLEYQYWSGTGPDNNLVLNYMYNDAADEFQGRMYDLYRKIDTRKMSPLNQTSKYNSELAFYALSLTMERRHHFQKEFMRKHPRLKLVSFQEIIEGALVKEMQGAELEPYEVILLSGINKEIILELYKARVDMNAAFALRDLVDERKMTISHFSRAGIFIITGGRLSEIDIPETFKEANDSTYINVINYLQKARTAKAFLKRIGVEYKMEKKLRSALKALELETSENDRSAISYKTQIEHLIQSLI